jgi:hypothetical protein
MLKSQIKERIAIGCEPCLGDVANIADNDNDIDDECLSPFCVENRPLRDTVITVTPKDLQKLTMDLAVTLSKEELKLICEQYRQPRLSEKSGQDERRSNVDVLSFADLNDSGRA